MTVLERYSEPYNPTGGLAAEGVINQLGRPDIEPLEVLVREAVQNCWDAKRPDARAISVEIGRRTLTGDQVSHLSRRVLPDPPPGLPLGDQLRTGIQLLHFADFGTDGLGGPTRADSPGEKRDFVDFIRNIGQPPDKDLGGGSFGYGKAAFYIASAARTIIVDTLCRDSDGRLDRRLMACGLGDNFDLEGRPYTGRHWWGQLVDGVPEPVRGDDAARLASELGLPPRDNPAALGSTVVIVAPNVGPEAEDGGDVTMPFIAEALAWNFWPRMVDTQGSARHSMRFIVTDDGRSVSVPNPRTHDRLRGFVDALDRLRLEPADDDGLVLDRSIECHRPSRRLGRLVVQKDPVAPMALPPRAVPQGAQVTADAVHHVALMRNAELVVKYLPGAAPVTGRTGYSGVFKCAVDVDEAFRKAEPPTHDDWIYRSVPKEHYQQRFVKVALERIAEVCREAAGYDAMTAAATEGSGVPLGEFADALAGLMPGFDGPGARRSQPAAGPKPRRRSRIRPVTVSADEADWVEGSAAPAPAVGGPDAGPSASATAPSSERPRRPAPQTRATAGPAPALADDGAAVVRYPFRLRSNGNRVRLSARVEIMANDGGQVEGDAPAGALIPAVRSWTDASGVVHAGASIEVAADADGDWVAEVPLVDEVMMRVELDAEAL